MVPRPVFHRKQLILAHHPEPCEKISSHTR
jgi:hypothetical protein